MKWIDKGRKAYQFGKEGKKYPVSEYGKKGAEEKAALQGRAIEANKHKKVRVIVPESKRARGYTRQI